MDVRNSIDGSLQISNEVVAKIAKLAALEIDGVADVSSAARKMAELQLLLSGCALREEPLYAMAHEQLSQEGN